VAEVLTDTSASAVAWALEHNYEASLSAIVSASGTLQRDDELTVGLSRIPGRAFNGVFRAQLRPDRTPDQIAALVAATLRQFADAGCPMRWFVGPSTTPPDLGTYLVAAGLTAVGDHPAMGIELAIAPDEPTPPDLRIEPVSSLEAALTWARVSTEGFGGALPGDDSAVRVFASAVLSSPSQHIYLGWQGGEAVATCAACYAAGVVGLYSIATLPQARRRGVGRAMTLAALREARAQGYRVGVLESSEIGEPVYTSVGFRKVCSMPGFIWSPAH
jgi:GNAT superfamily N-acetyltransferase